MGKRYMSYGMLGKKHSKATKKLMSKQRKGKAKSESFKKLMSVRMSGDNNPSKRPEVREKIKKARAKQVFSAETRQKMSDSRKRRPLTGRNWSKCTDCGVVRDMNYLVGRCKNCYLEHLKTHSGEKHPLWKGTQTINKYLRNTTKYKQWRTAVFERDNYTCQHCGDRGVEIQADHIEAFAMLLAKHNVDTIQRALICAELWNISNGQTLCVPCHRKTPTWGYQKQTNQKENACI